MKKIVFATCALLIGQSILAQRAENVITTAVPFLQIAADARAAGLGDQGVATSADVFSQMWNPAKYAFAEDKHGFAVSYTPYLSELVNDISISQVNYYNRFKERSAFAVSLRYFSLGTIIFRQDEFDLGTEEKPNELALDLSYSLQLSRNFSMAVAGRYIRSQLRLQRLDLDASPANAFAFDVAGFYQSDEVAFSNFNGRWRAGFNFQNMGPKLSYDLDNNDLNSNFIPATARIGGAYDFIFDGFNKLTVQTEFAKLMVPTPDFTDENGNTDDIKRNEYNRIGWVQGMFRSFGDAPGGMSEELREVTWAIGAEYWYQDSFALRLGYFNEHETKGARKFYTLGAGFKYNVVKIDVSYLFSASNVRNPLENTLRFSLSFNFGDKYDDL